MTDQPVPVRIEYVGEVDGGHLWQVRRTDTDELIGWNLTPTDTDTDNDGQ